MSRARVTIEPDKIDIRNYVGILFFRWKVIVLCFLYSLLAGVVYLQIARPLYETTCQVMIYRDPSLTVSQSQAHWQQLRMHALILASTRVRNTVIDRLTDRWESKVGGRREMWLPVTTSPLGHSGNTILEIGVKGPYPAYNEAFLHALLEEYRQERQTSQKEVAGSVTKVLEDELARLQERIRGAEEDLIEYRRKNNMAYVDTKASIETRYLTALMQRRNELQTERILFEAQYPYIKDASAAVITDIDELTRESGAVSPFEVVAVTGEEGAPAAAAAPGAAAPPEEERFVRSERRASARIPPTDDGGWQSLRIELLRLQLLEKEQAKTHLENHPRLMETRKKIAEIEERLGIARQVALERLKARQEALGRHETALETAENRWQASAILSSKRQAEYQRLAMILERYVQMHQTLYSRLQELRVSEELKAEHYSVKEDISTDPGPVWPNARKIMLVALAMGMAAGVGLAFLMQIFDNKVQSVRDVEEILGLEFLGGVPFWVHSGLGRRLRPIVTDDHAAGAIEAYRALRTTILGALEKRNENLCLVSSADSKEGKTLTVLNLAVMIAQMGKRVLLVDMDLRRGRLHQSLDQERSPGMTDLLDETVTLRDVIRETQHENLSLLPAGKTVVNTPELLQSADLEGLFSGLKRQYDYILVDTAPILRVTDTVITASPRTGVLILVAAANRTPKPVVRYSLSLLRDAEILGLVLNAIEMHKISSLYYSYQYPNYAYYSNAYAYGYSYGEATNVGPMQRMRRGLRRLSSKTVYEWLRRALLPME
ncbi:MAG: polysaccharide biosynthesis tyrosine autokinase [Kiritimatiellae bacterium]|nr:polysaccharide biosynthesis tyrosine autokinase [Kiritimatiellia bacterium]